MSITTTTDLTPGEESPGGALDDKRVILCLGSGGVGKTTVSAALALAFARRGERVVVLTIDPARRLADTLGDELDNEPRLVAFTDRGPDGTGPPSIVKLWATMLDPTATFESVVRAEARSEEQAEKILVNPLFRNLTHALSGTNEYMAAERLHQLFHDERFDRVVVDTPPSRHALDFLDSPGRLHRFVNHRLYRSVFAPRGLMRTVSAGSQLLLRLLGRIVGSRLVDDVITFFANFEGLDSGFDRRSLEIERVLNHETALVLVTSPRQQALDEGRWIAGNIEQRLGDDALTMVIVNRACPVDPTEPAPSGKGPLAVNLRQLQALASQERDLVERFLASRPTRPNVARLIERTRPISDADGLLGLAHGLSAEFVGRA